MQVEEKAAAPLSGVVVCVSKKLSKKQSELNAVAASLGADFRYMPNLLFSVISIIFSLKVIMPSEMLVGNTDLFLAKVVEFNPFSLL